MEMFSKQYSRLTGVGPWGRKSHRGTGILTGDVAHTQQSNPSSNRHRNRTRKSRDRSHRRKTRKDRRSSVGTQLVNVLFSVNDKQNKYINDLVKEDVQILEDGKPRRFFIFKRETDLPLTMAMLIDTSGSEQHTLPRLKETAAPSLTRL
jgi:hypothetical protein